MKTVLSLALAVSLVPISNLTAATHYVSLTSKKPRAPYTSWATAAKTIQVAMRACQPNDTVVVTNGVYGGVVRVAIPLTLRSVNGAPYTTIDAGGNDVCLSLTNGVSVWGFTLTDGVDALGDGGSGVSCVSTNAWLTNCVITGNLGGGVHNGTLYNCAVFANYGLGVNGAALYNCTVTCNSGGANNVRAFNSILYFNTLPSGANYDSTCSFDHCCTSPLPSLGAGNIELDPQLASGSHLSVGSPCRAAGNADYASGRDIDGEVWNTPPSMGCDEYHPGAVTGPLHVDLMASDTRVTPGYGLQFTSLIDGKTTASSWDFGDGTVASNRPTISHAWGTTGKYKVLLRAFNETVSTGITASLKIQVTQEVHYVAASNSHPHSPFTSWASAAKTIQDAVNATVLPGASVLVTNGTYAGGINVTKPMVLRSINGPRFTTIDARYSSRCLTLSEGVGLTGFTLTNGYVASSTALRGLGGGVYCASTNVWLTNCVIAGNATHGVWTAGYSPPGPPYGGGWRPPPTPIFKAGCGGGVYRGTLYNCTLYRNSANAGGGACESTLYNCTVVTNWAFSSSDVVSGWGRYSFIGSGGGVSGGAMYNCIVCYNNGANGSNYAGSVLNYCCTAALPASGVSNIDLDPCFQNFANYDFRLQSDSPCINAGNNAWTVCTTDLDGNPRVIGGQVDMGAYECQAAASLARNERDSGATGVSTGFTASDATDGKVRQAVSTTLGDPTLFVLAPVVTANGVAISWTSVSSASYFVARSLDLSGPFTVIATNIAGQDGITTYQDTNNPGAGAFFYRVGMSR